MSFNTNTITKEKRIVKVNNTIIGYIQNSQFIKPVNGSKHQLKCPPAWAIDANVFDNEVKPCASQIVILDRETSNRYITSVHTFDSNKKQLDRGFGLQYYLTLRHWKVEQSDARQLNLFAMGGGSC